jgi:phosphomannomutase
MPIHISAHYKNAFKDADIRGVYPTEIDEEVVYLVARAFVAEYKSSEVVVARDMRLSSDSLYEAFCKGVNDAGADVLDIGLVHTPLLYFVSGTKQLPGVMITASHSPKNYNGLKLVLPGAVPLTEKHGLAKLRRKVERGVFVEAKRVGKIRRKDFRAAYQRFVCRGTLPKAVAQMSVAVDCGGGMASVMLPLLAARWQATFTSLFTELDGTFTSRGSDPTLKKNQRHITQLLKSKSFDFGVAFDGDSDRIAFFDETGAYINSAIIGAVIAAHLLKQQPGAKIVYTNLTSRIFEETIKAALGVPVMARVGHAFIKESLRKHDAIFGAEHSGHFYFKEYFYTDSVALTLKYMLAAYAVAKQEGKSFSSFIAPYRKYEQTEDVIVAVDNQPAALAKVHAFLMKKKPKQVKVFDGYSVDFGTVWGAVKISVTEPALKMMFEGYKKKEAQQLQDEVVAFVRSIAKD